MFLGCPSLDTRRRSHGAEDTACLSGDMDGGQDDLQVAASAAEKNAILLEKSSTIFFF